MRLIFFCKPEGILLVFIISFFGRLIILLLRFANVLFSRLKSWCIWLFSRANLLNCLSGLALIGPIVWASIGLFVLLTLSNYRLFFIYFTII
jgi:hypothetical protein